jgi:hypothetical protein
MRHGVCGSGALVVAGTGRCAVDARPRSLCGSAARVGGVLGCVWGAPGACLGCIRGVFGVHPGFVGPGVSPPHPLLSAQAMDARIMDVGVDGRIMEEKDYHRDWMMDVGVLFMNLDCSIDHMAIRDMAQMFGEVAHCAVCTDRNGASLRFGFASFLAVGTEPPFERFCIARRSQQAAVRELDGSELNDNEIVVVRWVRWSYETLIESFVAAAERAHSVSATTQM